MRDRADGEGRDGMLFDMGAVRGDVAYPVEEWRAALETAEYREWCDIDAADRGEHLAAWLCWEVAGLDDVGRDEDHLTAAFRVLVDAGERAFTPDRLMTVLRSTLGPVWDGSPDGTHMVSTVSEDTGIRYRFDASKW